MDSKLKMLIYCKLCSKDGSIFCTSSSDNHIVLDELIVDGLIVEVNGPGGADRAFALTHAGELKMANVLMLSSEII